MRKKISALVAVRKNSRRIVGKNIRPFAGSSLLEIKISQLLRMPEIDEVCVSSDCATMVSMAEKMGARGIIRESKFASDKVPMNQVYAHLASEVTYEHVLYAHVTSPLLSDESLKKCIEKYQNLPSKYDSLATVKSVKDYIWDANGAINYDPDCHPRSQDLPHYYALNFAVNILPQSVMIKKKNIVGKSFYPYFLDKIESIDIDEKEDFLIAELLFHRLNIENNL